MMTTIWKFQFVIDDEIVVQMPAGATILAIESQNGTPMMWAQVNPRAPKISRWFRIIGTGHMFDDDRLKFVATFQQPPFVWHVFERVESMESFK